MYDDKQTWTFAAVSPQLQEQGFIPGAISASVDKKDGHVWSWDEQTQFYQRVAEAKRLQAA